jgi:hypothetical protein
MTDSIAILPPGWQAVDDSGVILSGAHLYVYTAGTTTPLSVYSDNDLSVSLGAVIVCDSAGYLTSDGSARVVAYTGTADYKVVLKDSDGVTIWTYDNVRAATASPAAASTATPVYPVTVLTTTTTVVTGDRGKQFQCVCTGGSFVVTLPSAVTAGDNWVCGFVHDGSANSVTISTVSSQTITYRGQARTSVSLLSRGEAIEIVSNGAQWLARSTGTGKLSGSTGVLVVTDRLNTPPGSPSAGALYIVTSGPAGAWSSYAEHDVVEADGAGGWLRYTPAEGLFARVLDENLFTAFDGSTWVDQTGMRRPTTVTIPVAVFLDQRTSGTAGGTPTTGAWTTSTFQTTPSGNTLNVTLAANTFTVPQGTHLVRVWKQFHGTRKTQLRLKSAGQTFLLSQNYMIADGGTSITGPGVAMGSAIVTVSASTEDFTVDYYVEHSSGNISLGYPASRASVSETYAGVEFLSLTPSFTWP